MTNFPCFMKLCRALMIDYRQNLINTWYSDLWILCRHYIEIVTLKQKLIKFWRQYQKENDLTKVTEIFNIDVLPKSILLKVVDIAHEEMIDTKILKLCTVRTKVGRVLKLYRDGKYEDEHSYILDRIGAVIEDKQLVEKLYNIYENKSYLKVFPHMVNIFSLDILKQFLHSLFLKYTSFSILNYLQNSCLFFNKYTGKLYSYICWDLLLESKWNK